MFLALACVGGWGLPACGGTAREVQKSKKRVDLAKDLLSHEQDAAAETELKKAIAYDPRNEEAINLLGLVYVFRAHRNVLLVEYEDCLQGSVADGLRTEAEEQMRTAERYFSEATKLAPDFGEAWQNRAAVAVFFHDWDKAIAHAKRALGQLARLNRESMARANLGWAYFHKQEHARAAAELLQATQRDPGFCLGNYRMAALHFELKELDQAASRVAPLIDDPKKCPVQEARYLAGQVYIRLHDSAAAERALRSCVEMAPKSCQAKRCARTLQEIAGQAGRLE
ncbi:MAG: tetratricopeptide repeat protein [Deltaproteobacteria bacterium]|nr:tetratricopeptide repeat protein [Deltaproteobacteria bacterium]